MPDLTNALIGSMPGEMNVQQGSGGYLPNGSLAV